jgi:hypothetical protein
MLRRPYPLQWCGWACISVIQVIMLFREFVSFMLGKHSDLFLLAASTRCTPHRSWAGWSLVAALALSVSGCGSLDREADSHRYNVVAHETFGSSATYSRLFDAPPERACEAARRALLSQGYLINVSKGKEVEGQKSFQPATDNHQIITIRVVCAADSKDGKVTLGFVSALKDTYNLKKSSNSASVGVGALGSLSLPFSAGNDSMVKVGSETVSSATFYDSFFDLIKSYLRQDDELRQQSLTGDEEFVE